MKPEAFSCVACGLKIAGFSKLLAAGLGNTYILTSHYDAVSNSRSYSLGSLGKAFTADVPFLGNCRPVA
jgi:hypothetical protein